MQVVLLGRVEDREKYLRAWRTLLHASRLGDRVVRLVSLLVRNAAAGSELSIEMADRDDNRVSVCLSSK